MYKNIICLFSFPYSTWNVWNCRMTEKMKEGWDVHIEWDTNLQWITSSFCFNESGTGPSQGIIFVYLSLLYFLESGTGPPQGIIFVYPHFSTFLSLVQGHLKASSLFLLTSLLSWVWYRATSRHHLCFSSLLYFLESGTGPPQGIIFVSSHFSTFLSLVQGHLKASSLFLLTSLLSWVWYRATSRHHLCFSSLLYFLESGTGPPQGIIFVSPHFSGTGPPQCFLESGTGPPQGIIFVSPHISTFLSLVQGHLKASSLFLLTSLLSWVWYRATSRHHLCFSSLLYFLESGTGPPQGIIFVSPHFSTFLSLVQGHLKASSLFLTLYFLESISTFLSLVQGHLKASSLFLLTSLLSWVWFSTTSRHHLCFFSLLYFLESGIGPPQGTKSS